MLPDSNPDEGMLDVYMDMFMSGAGKADRFVIQHVH